MKDLLNFKKEKKAGNPEFIRQDAHKKPRVGTNWRKPRGRQSKMRLQLAGYRAIVKTGYGTPKILKDCNRDGLKQVMVNSLGCLENIDATKEGIIVASSIGTRKKIQILKIALEKNIAVLNIKDAKAFIEEKTKAVESKKKESKEKIAARIQKKKDIEKAANKDKKEKSDKAGKTAEKKADKVDTEKQNQNTMAAQKVMTKKEM